MTHKDDLLAKFATHDARGGVIGLGYVGLPLALTFAEKGFVAIGLDVDPRKIEALLQGRRLPASACGQPRPSAMPSMALRRLPATIGSRSTRRRLLLRTAGFPT